MLAESLCFLSCVLIGMDPGARMNLNPSSTTYLCDFVQVTLTLPWFPHLKDGNLVKCDDQEIQSWSSYKA